MLLCKGNIQTPKLDVFKTSGFELFEEDLKEIHREKFREGFSFDNLRLPGKIFDPQLLLAIFLLITTTPLIIPGIPLIDDQFSQVIYRPPHSVSADFSF